MLFWVLILGVYMGWVNAVTSPSKTATAPPQDWYAPLPNPPEYLSNKVLEPDDTPKVADHYVRHMARSKG